MLQVLLMRAFLFVLLPTFSYSWGTTGHEIVANVAWDSLSKRTQAWVEDILNTTGSTNTTEEDQSPLGAVADWADRVRHFLPWSGPLHYIDVRDDLLSHGCHVAPHLNPTCQFLYERDCANNTCVAGAIVNYTQQLLKRQQRQRQPKLQLAVRGTSTGSNEIPQTKEALMFLTHFIGDIHQPLHCSRVTDKGGNDIHVHFNLLTDNESTSKHGGWNLHSVWDTGLIDVALAREYNHSRALLEQDLLSQLKASKDKYRDCDMAFGANRTCTIQWGQESWDAAIRFAYTLPDNRTDVTNGASLEEEYYKSRWPLAKERLLAGAVRLAGTLEWIVQQNPPSVEPTVIPSLTLESKNSLRTTHLLSWLSWNSRILVLAKAYF